MASPPSASPSSSPSSSHLDLPPYCPSLEENKQASKGNNRIDQTKNNWNRTKQVYRRGGAQGKAQIRYKVKHEFTHLGIPENHKTRSHSIYTRDL